MTFAVMPEGSPVVEESAYIHRFYAMASPFAFHLVGENPQFLGQIGRELEEIVRQKEQTLSKYDPGSELYRINQEAAKRPVQCSVEMFSLLSKSLRAYVFTDGFFDIAWEKEKTSGIHLPDCLHLDSDGRTVFFWEKQVKLDFGGVGKGYALDQVAMDLGRWGIDNFLLNAGNSSAIAKGMKSEQQNWTIQHQHTHEKFDLNNQAFSCSRSEHNRYFVFGPDGFSTEIISTALIEMQEKQAKTFSNGLGDTYNIF